jgi:hypothetical protein
MAKDYVFIDYFYGVEQFDRAFGDAQGQLEAIKLGMKPKRPDKSKLKTLLDKASKPPTRAKGQFVLSRDKDKISFLILIGTTRTVLATLDLAAVKDIAKRRDLLFQLSYRTDLVTKADLKAFDEEHADAEDRPEAVELNKQIDEQKNIIDSSKGMLIAANYKGTEYSEWSSDFAAWIKLKGHQRFTAFVDDVKNGRGLGNEARKLLADSKSGIKKSTMDAIKVAAAAGQTPDFTQARKEVLVVVNALLKQFNKEKIAEHQGYIKAAEAQIAALQKRLKVMKAD